MKQKLSFETARNMVKLLLAAAAALCVLALIVGEDTFGMYAAVAALVCVVLTIMVLLTCMKCPYCGRLIVRKCLVVKSCPHCNRNLSSGLKGKKGRK